MNRWRKYAAAALGVVLASSMGVYAAQADAGSVQYEVKAPVTVQAFGRDTANITAGQEVTFGAKLVAAEATHVDELIFAVRDSEDRNGDFGVHDGYDLTTSQKTFTASHTFQQGTYTVWVAYRKGAQWVNLAPNPAQTFTVGAAQTPSPTPTPTTPTPTPTQPPSGSDGPTSGPAAGMSLAFHDGFTGTSLDRSKWATTSWSYPNGGPTNGGDSKLDYLTDSALKVSDGTLKITATKRSDGLWNTGLITTGNAKVNPPNSFKMRTGDFTVAHVKLPTQAMGAWPALWSWNDGGNEIDSFEWHGDNPNLLELTNHIRGGGKYVTDSRVGPGKWFYIGTKFGATSNTYYLGTTLENMTPIWSDGTGVGSNWGGAYPILNLSISSGRYHPVPVGSTPIVFEVGNYRVYR